MNIKGKTIIVTGGASGLGLATVMMIMKNGGNATIIDVNENAGAHLAFIHPTQILFVKCDVSSEEDVENAIHLTKEKFGKFDGLVNCAGIGDPKRVVGKEGPHDLMFFKKIINVNLVGSFNCIRLVANEMQHNEAEENGERGIIINTASVAAYDGQVGQAAYAASKGGIVALTLPIAREFARMGIRVMTIAPGLFETPLLASLPADAQESLGKQVPFPSRLGRPEEYASLVKHIIENCMLNGEVIRLDGAIRMAAK